MSTVRAWGTALQPPGQRRRDAEPVALAPQEEREPVEVEAAYQRLRIGKPRRQRPVRREYAARHDRAVLSQVPNLLAVQDAPRHPRHQVAAAQRDSLPWS